jgi:hypothetical protein
MDGTDPDVGCGIGVAVLGLVVPTAAFRGISPAFTASTTSGVAWAVTTLAWRIVSGLVSDSAASCSLVNVATGAKLDWLPAGAHSLPVTTARARCEAVRWLRCRFLSIAVVRIAKLSL